MVLPAALRTRIRSVVLDRVEVKVATAVVAPAAIVTRKDFVDFEEMVPLQVIVVGTGVGAGVGTGVVEQAAVEALGKVEARALDGGVLAIQGPPGTGKTFTGAHLIVALVKAGKRVGVTATAHKVIGNLLDEVAEVARQQDVPLVIGQKPSTDGEPTHKPARNLRSAKDVATMLGLGVVQVVGGTAWTWAHDAVRDALDVLVVDEAGQMSLANAVAVSGAARSLILLGDPRQLEQPIQGLHPPGADAAALEQIGRALV